MLTPAGGIFGADEGHRMGSPHCWKRAIPHHDADNDAARETPVIAKDERTAMCNDRSARTVRCHIAREEGISTLYVVLLLLAGFMAVSLFFMDYMRLYISRRGVQNAVDSSALAGAEEYADRLSTCCSPVVATQFIDEQGECGQPRKEVAEDLAKRYKDDYYNRALYGQVGQASAQGYASRNGLEGYVGPGFSTTKTQPCPQAQVSHDDLRNVGLKRCAIEVRLDRGKQDYWSMGLGKSVDGRASASALAYLDSAKSSMTAKSEECTRWDPVLKKSYLTPSGPLSW